jgi:LPS-assembly protein
MKNGCKSLLFMLFVAAMLAVMTRHARGEDPPKKIPVTVAADKLDYDRANDRYLATGHVKIEQDGMHLEADKVVLDNRTGEAKADGSVFLQDKGDIIHADNMQVNLNTRDGIMVNGEIFIKNANLHMKGNLIKRHSDTQYHIEKGIVTTCDEDEWFLKADVLDIDMERYATGRRLSFNVKGLPVLYTPYFLFPVRRQTGFLMPESLGYSNHDGIFANNAFFWAISDYKDVTIYSDYRERTGHGTGIEYRYRNSRESMGQLYYKVFDLYHTGEYRWNVRLQHQEEFAEDLSGRVDINLVSDENYFYDLDKKLENKSLPYLDSNAFYVERWNTASLYLTGQYSIDLTRTNEKTVQKLPELRYTIYDEALAGPFHLNFDGSAVNFTKQDGDGTRRIDFNPRLTATFGSSGLSITPNAGVRATFYDRSATTVEPTERKYSYAGAEVNARVSQVYGADGGAGIGRIRHSIEPTISYSYVPHIDQGDIPQFDSVDTATEQNLASIALINRVTAHYRATQDAPYTTFDVMVFRLSRSYDFNVARDLGSTSHPGSDILGELYFRTPTTFNISATGNYNAYDRIVSSHSEGVGFTKSVVSLNLTHSFIQGESEYLISGAGLTFSAWNLHVQISRDIRNTKTIEQDLLLHYTSQCWGISVRYTALPGEYRYTAMVDLKGLGSGGSK